MPLKRIGAGPYWRIASWSREQGTGSIKSGVGTLPFDRAVARVDDFVVGESVWVTLAPAPGRSFWVTGVRPHLARFVPPSNLDAAGVPELDAALAARAARVLASLPSPFYGHARRQADALIVRAWELTRNEYRLAFCDVHLDGELRFLRPLWSAGAAPGFFEVARVCSPIERAYVDSCTRVGARDLAVALVGRFADGPAVSFVLCADLTWTPAPPGGPLGVLEEAATRAYGERPYVALRVEEANGTAFLVAVDEDGGARKVCNVEGEDVVGAQMWADAVSEALGPDPASDACASD